MSLDLELQASRLYNLEDNYGRADLRPEDVRTLLHVAEMGIEECMEGHHPQIAEQMATLRQKYAEHYGVVPVPRAPGVAS